MTSNLPPGTPEHATDGPRERPDRREEPDDEWIDMRHLLHRIRNAQAARIEQPRHPDKECDPW